MDEELRDEIECHALDWQATAAMRRLAKEGLAGKKLVGELRIASASQSDNGPRQQGPGGRAADRICEPKRQWASAARGWRESRGSYLRTKASRVAWDRLNWLPAISLIQQCLGMIVDIMPAPSQNC
jgi:hypothetical protein